MTVQRDELILVSVDDHICEPADMFDAHVPATYRDRMPRVVDEPDGSQQWYYGDLRGRNLGLNAVAGKPPEMFNVNPTRYEEMRPGCYDIHARVKDMDINGVWASVNFPSQITGFCGRVFSQCSDPELGLAVTRAWNDWFAEEWYAPYPERIVPMGITYLGDPERGADEIRRNAERGFVAVTLPEQPHRVDMPNLFQGWWDPIIEACAETGTVICLHVGSTGVADMPPGSPMVALGATLFGQLSLSACAEWLWSGYPVKHPDLKIAMSEGGIGWVAMLHDRLENIVDRSGYGDYFSGDQRPAEVLHRNFWFCTIDDPSTICTRDTVGVDRIMFETDYPHGDGTWPDSQAVFEQFYGGLPVDEIAMISHENAAALYRHPLPPPDEPHAAGLRRR